MVDQLDELKSVHVNFINKKLAEPLLLDINGTIAPYEVNAKYLGMTLTAKLRWEVHVKKENSELGLKYKWKKFQFVNT